MAGNAGEIKVVLTAEQGDFVAGLRQAEGQVDRLGKEVGKAGAHAKGFSLHMLTSRAALSTFAAATGTSLGELRHLQHALHAVPIGAGVAVAALLLAKTIFESHTEATRKAAEANNQFAESFDKIRREQEGLELSKVGLQLKEIGELEHKISQERIELGGPGIGESIANRLGIVTGGLGFYIAHKLKEDREQRLGELNSQEQRLRKLREGTLNEPTEEAKKEGGASHIEKAVSAAQLAVEKVEHSQEVNLLTQIAQNTAAMANAPDPAPATGGNVSHFNSRAALKYNHR